MDYPGTSSVADDAQSAIAAAKAAAIVDDQKTKDQLAKKKANDTADAGVKGNLFGKKFDVEAFFSSPAKMIGTILVVAGLIAFIIYFRKGKKKE